MSDHHHHRAAESESRVSADRGALLKTVIHLWPYIWPSDRRDLKLRAIGAMVLLLAAKLATISVPFTFKWAIDALAGGGSAPVAPSQGLVWALAVPVAMTIAYGGMRILMAVLTQLRDGLFAKVAMHAVRRLAFRTFVHMHELSLRFHLIAASSITGAATLDVNLPASYNPSYPYQGYLDYTTTPGLVDFVLTAAPPTARALTWSGTNAPGVPDGDWDVATTADWLTNGVATIYNQYDLATFNDVSSPAQTNINLTTTIIPYSLTVSNAASLYTFGGGGNISGGTGLTKQGMGTLILDNGTPNDFMGGVTISGGILQVGNNR